MASGPGDGVSQQLYESRYNRQQTLIDVGGVKGCITDSVTCPLKHTADWSMTHLSDLSMTHLSDLSMTQLSDLSMTQLSDLSVTHLSNLSMTHLSNLSMTHLLTWVWLTFLTLWSESERQFIKAFNKLGLK